MRLTYDSSLDAAYIYLEHEIEAGAVAKTYCCDPNGVGGTINLDFDADGRLLGIEVLNASRKLTAKLLSDVSRS